MRVSFQPHLPVTFPYRTRVAGVFTKVAVSPTGAAYLAGLLGPEAVLQALRAAAFEAMIVYRNEHPNRPSGSLMDAFLDAFRIATTNDDDLAVEIIEVMDMDASDERILAVAGILEK